MPLPRSDELRRLHFINAWFAPLTGRDLYLAEQIKTAIAFSLRELAEQTAGDPEGAARYDAAFNAAAARLLDKLFREHPEHGFYHWDALRTLTSATPLFARAELMEGLKALARYRESTLLVTNLRPAFLPPDRRPTVRGKRDYQEALTFIRDLTAARIARRAQLHLLFL